MTEPNVVGSGGMFEEEVDRIRGREKGC